MNGKFTSKLLFIFVMTIGVIFTGQISAQTVLVNYDFATATETPCAATPLTTASGITSTFTTGGNGNCTTPAGTAAGSPPAFVANAISDAVSVTGFAAGSTNSFRFQLSGVASYQNYSLFFQSRRSATGPGNVDIQYSLDGVAFTTFQTFTPPGAFNATGTTVDLSAVSAIENQPTVFFRLLGRDGTGGTGTFAIDNFQVRAFSTTAAGVEVGGRVMQPSGRGIFNVRVTITDLTGDARTTMTDMFGRFRFTDVGAGQTYIFSAAHRRYQFEEPTQIQFIGKDTDNINFVGTGGLFSLGSAPKN